MEQRTEIVPAPKCGLYFSQEDVQQGLRNAEVYPWAGQGLERLKAICEQFLMLTDDEVYGAVIGMHKGTFAYGISGCPHCGVSFPMDAEKQEGMFSGLEMLPVRTVTCLECRTVFPNGQYPDDGSGFERDGKAYYMIGMWNFYHAGRLLGGVRNHEGMVTKLTAMYMLTGDRRYAKRAMLLLDAFAAIFPNTIGPRDFTSFGSDFEIGRLHLLTSIVHRVKVWLAHDYDWLYYEPEMSDSSTALQRLGRKGTVRENIESMLNDYMLSEPGGPVYDLSEGKITNLQNHEADGVRAMLSVGLVSGNQEYCKWGTESLPAYIYNAVGRDGMYFESSYGYSVFTASVYLDIALLSLRASALFGLPLDPHPFGNRRFYRFAVENPLEMLCEGHLPSYGDWGNDRREGAEPDGKLSAEVYRSAQYFYRFSPDESIRVKAGNMLRLLYPLVEDQLGGRCMDLFFPHNGIHLAAGKPISDPEALTVMGQNGLAIVRNAPSGTTALMRFGRSNTHGHDDVLAYVYYANGKEISGDIGYGVYGTNAHYGWASKSVAHNTVVVNRDRKMKRNQLFKPFAGGELSIIHRSDTVAALEADATELYADNGVTMYRRFVGLVRTSGSASYTIDFFRVEGAVTADYAFHAFQDSSSLQLEQVRPSARRHWTLAGVDSPEKLYFDEPGKSFGERLTTGETFVPLFEGEEPRLWTTDLNNGYGYIYDVKEFEPEQDLFRALWQTEETKETLVLLGVCDPGDRLFAGRCPNLEGNRKHGILIHRGMRPQKQFAAVSFLGAENGATPVVEGVQRRAVSAGEHVTALAVQLPGGITDYWMYSPNFQTMEMTLFGQSWSVTGRSAMLRLDGMGRVIEACCVMAERMHYGEYNMNGIENRWTDIEQIDEESGTAWIREHPPLMANAPQFVRIRNREDGTSAVYKIQGVSVAGQRTAVQMTDSFILSKGIVESLSEGELVSKYPIPLGVMYEGSSPFRGKRIIGNQGGLGIITEIPELKTILMKVIRPFRLGEAFDIVDMEPGYQLQWM